MSSSKLEVFDIVFENNDVDYFRPGDLVQGFVLVVLSAEKRHIRGIKVKLKGKTKTDWQKADEKYNWKEVLFEHSVLVFGEDDKSDRSYILPSGEHKFPFRYRLPGALPPELYCKYAKVSYVVKAIIDRPRRYDHSAQRAFKIRPVVDLNIIPDVLHPVGDQITMRDGCMCCETGPITLEASIDKRGYVVGESIWISGCIDNQTNSDIMYVSCLLIQTMTFFAKSGWTTDDKRVKEYVIELELDGCPSYEKKDIEPTAFIIPPVVPCAFESCPNIFLEYSLKVTAVMGFDTSFCSVKLPLSIGTIPARNIGPRSPVNMAVTHQSEVKRMVPPPPSYDIAVSSYREVESRRDEVVPTRGHPARLFPELPIISNYAATDNILPLSCSARTPPGKSKPDAPITSQERSRTSPGSTNYSTLPAHGSMSPMTRSKYDTLPTIDRRRETRERSMSLSANYTSSPTNVSCSLRSSSSRLRYDSTPTSERSGESTALLTNRMMTSDYNTYYDTSLGYGQMSMDPWRSQSELIRDAPQEQNMSRTRGRIAEAFV